MDCVTRKPDRPAGVGFRLVDWSVGVEILRFVAALSESLGACRGECDGRRMKCGMGHVRCNAMTARSCRHSVAEQ